MGNNKRFLREVRIPAPLGQGLALWYSKDCATIPSLHRPYPP